MNDLDPEKVAEDAWRVVRESEEAEQQRRTDDLTLKMLRQILGPAAGMEPPRFDRNFAERLLQDQAWDKRLAGLVILREYCRAECQGDSSLVAQIAKMSTNDSHSQVRGVALHTVGGLLKSSRDPKYGKYLARLVLDPSLPVSMRASAYIGLCDLHGVAVPIIHEPAELMRQVDEDMLHWYAGRETSHRV